MDRTFLGDAKMGSLSVLELHWQLLATYGYEHLKHALVQTKELNFEIYLILTNTDNHLWLVVTV